MTKLHGHVLQIIWSQKSLKTAVGLTALSHYSLAECSTEQNIYFQFTLLPPLKMFVTTSKSQGYCNTCSKCRHRAVCMLLMLVPAIARLQVRFRNHRQIRLWPVSIDVFLVVYQADTLCTL